MHFYLQNIENPNRETLQILFIILSVACPSSRSETKNEIEDMNSVSRNTNHEISNSTFPLSTMISSDALEQIKIRPSNLSKNGVCDIIKSSENHALSNIPRSIQRADLDSNEFLDNRSTLSRKHFKAENDSYEIDIENENENVKTTEQNDFHKEKPTSMPVEIETEMENDIERIIESATPTQIPMEESSKKTQELSSLSLLSMDDDSNEDNENVVIATIQIRKRLVEERQNHHYHQQQQPQQSIRVDNEIPNRGDSSLSTSNHRNYRNKTTEGPNSTIISFKQLMRQSFAEITATATATTNTIAQQMNGGSLRTTSTATKAPISSRKIEIKHILSKTQKTDAPMLNYIFDSFSSANKHHHHDQRYGPHFEDVERVGRPLNMTVQAGSSIHLNCRISLLQDKTVSWVRRNALGENALDLLTVGSHTYTGDKRYNLEFQYPSNWRLKIASVKKSDEATYECQISTHPPRVIRVNLLVNAPKVLIVDEFGEQLQEKYYEIDSTLQLSCFVRNIQMSAAVVFWKHGENILNYDVTRGGVSVKTELMDDGANSTLSIAKINKSDSGNYTCSISEFQNFTTVVHILNGESFAELHHGGAASTMLRHTLVINLTLLVLVLSLSATCISR